MFRVSELWYFIRADEGNPKMFTGDTTFHIGITITLLNEYDYPFAVLLWRVDSVRLFKVKDWFRPVSELMTNCTVTTQQAVITGIK